MTTDSFLVAITKQGKQVYFDLLVDSVQHSFNIYEDLIFCGVYLEGKKVPYPTTAIQKTFFNLFSSEERNLIASEFFDERLLLAQDYRKQNTIFTYTLDSEPLAAVINVEVKNSSFNANASLRKYLVLKPSLGNNDVLNASNLIIFDCFADVVTAPTGYYLRQYGQINFDSNLIEPVDFISYKVLSGVGTNLSLRVCNVGVTMTMAAGVKCVVRVYYNPYTSEYAVRLAQGTLFDFATSYLYTHIDTTPIASANQVFKKVGNQDFTIVSL